MILNNSKQLFIKSVLVTPGTAQADQSCLLSALSTCVPPPPQTCCPPQPVPRSKVTAGEAIQLTHHPHHCGRATRTGPTLVLQCNSSQFFPRKASVQPLLPLRRFYMVARPHPEPCVCIKSFTKAKQGFLTHFTR